MAVVRRELEKMRRHLPIRQLIKKVGRAIQAIKPVFMMSPISVAQFLEPGAVEFDLLLIDEASQVRPVDALGAVARCKQIVVVGDDRQLPPTTFFEKLGGGGADDENAEEDVRTSDLESILGLCRSKGLQPRMLQWHYRSKHHSLIAVSNAQFYDNKLFVVPSPDHQTSEFGLQFRFVADGVFDRGQTAQNRREAHEVAKAAIEHARKYPNLSLGIGTFSMAQRVAIENELERLWQQNRDVESFFFSPRDEPFFVKNLESLQGDERDVILISVGYGKDSSGAFFMNFGPLSREGGERRLNVLITRAKQRCEVFSSITADDIDVRRATSRGASALKTFLKYAESGIMDIGILSGKDFDSDFEREVARAIQGLGFELDTQVGVAGFFLDIAVRDPDCPGRYLLCIECDGASYHSSRSARDRDRLRQQVLEDRGWIVHRIWSTDWFKDSDAQLQKALQAIEAAKVRRSQGKGEQKVADVPQDRTEERDVDESEDDINDNQLAIDSMPVASIAVPYCEAEMQVRMDRPLPEVPVAGLARIVLSVVQVEGPIHKEEVARRVASFWGYNGTPNKRATS